MTSAILSLFMLGAISLDGVTGQDIYARAWFDANNVRLGDPMILTVEFVGRADFEELHPPELSKVVDRRVWKVDDASAKTETGSVGRRLVYRVRPLKEGVHLFPALEFAYKDTFSDDVKAEATHPLPVHVKPGAQAALAGLDADADGLPMPDGIVVETSARLGDDELFRWRKACRAPTAAAFAQFDFPEARLNEAACHIVEGNWAKAMRVYSLLEWRTGQTPTIERGIVAALARKHASAAVELPVWRSSFRAVLRLAWLGRALAVLGALASFALLLWLSRRIVRALACVALAVFLPVAAAAQQASDPYAEMDRRMQQMLQEMNTFMGVGGGLAINGTKAPSIKVSTSASATKPKARVGETFEFMFRIEAPKDATIDQIRISPSEMSGMNFITGSISQLADAPSANPSNVVHRYSTQVMYDRPFKGGIQFHVQGNASGRMNIGEGRSQSTFSYSQTFRLTTGKVMLDIQPLLAAGQPADFSGAVGKDFKFTQSVNRNKVATNDVVTVTWRLAFSGYVPPDFAASRDIVEQSDGMIAWRTYFVADGTEATPKERFVYYDTETKAYKALAAGGTALGYVPGTHGESVAVAVDAVAAKGGGRVLRLRFAPSSSAPVVATVPHPDAMPAPTEEPRGEWVRVEAGGHAGWIRKEEMRNEN